MNTQFTLPYRTCYVMLGLPPSKMQAYVIENWMALPIADEDDKEENTGEDNGEKEKEGEKAEEERDEENGNKEEEQDEDEGKELHEARERIQQWSMALQGDDKQRFNENWGLDDAGQFSVAPPGRDFSVGSSFSLEMYFREMRYLLYNENYQSSLQTDATPIGERVLGDELELVKSMVDEEVEFFETNDASNAEIGKRLLFLFQYDLLPGQQGKILFDKQSNVYFKLDFTTLEYKVR
jgi:hypothetical protein